jgi:hypothetical protein
MRARDGKVWEGLERGQMRQDVTDCWGPLDVATRCFALSSHVDVNLLLPVQARAQRLALEAELAAQACQTSCTFKPESVFD